MASEAQMKAAILELLLASQVSLEAMGQVLKRNRAIMLNPTFLQYCRSFNDEVDNERVHPMERFLQNAIEHDVTYAINQEKRIRSRIFEAAKAYLVVEADAAPTYAKQHQSILVSDECIFVIRGIIRDIERSNRISISQAEEVTQAIFRLKLNLLESAQEHDINTASRRYVQRLQELINNPWDAEAY